MDEMRLKLGTNFMKKVVSKLIARTVYKKYGYKVDIRIDDLDVWMLNGDTTVKLNVEAKLKNEEFTKIVKEIGLD